MAGSNLIDGFVLPGLLDDTGGQGHPPSVINDAQIASPTYQIHPGVWMILAGVGGLALLVYLLGRVE